MFAIVETGGKQYMVSEGNTLDIEKLTGNVENGAKIVFESVFLAKDADGKLFIGKPTLTNVTVEAEILKSYRDKKVIIFKARRRKNSRTKTGHRQSKMRVKITDIKFS
ncbi:MAG: 50S ribosomal protein L21 [Rickettsiales bacterium]|jgi:large subunit ribosomal protein L21|nr:50S ribosomal protein L21 [Rickettsiales bacterium]